MKENVVSVLKSVGTKLQTSQGWPIAMIVSVHQDPSHWAWVDITGLVVPLYLAVGFKLCTHNMTVLKFVIDDAVNLALKVNCTFSYTKTVNAVCDNILIIVLLSFRAAAATVAAWAGKGPGWHPRHQQDQKQCHQRKTLPSRWFDLSWKTLSTRLQSKDRLPWHITRRPPCHVYSKGGGKLIGDELLSRQTPRPFSEKRRKDSLYHLTE